MTAAHAELLKLYAAGSLKAAAGDIARAFEIKHAGIKVETTFGASGLLRKRIEGGEVAHLYASADMKQPRWLEAIGMAATSVQMFARNELCALARSDVDVNRDNLLEMMMSKDIRLGTSTPNADPAGDYAATLFSKAEAIVAGARARLESKALKLTGGPATKRPPKGRNQYGWVLSENMADIFLTYRTNAVMAQKDTPSLKLIAIPEPLAVGVEYGMVVMNDAPQASKDLAAFILGPEGQTILRDHGFGEGDDARE